ncbi:hypothetical protein [Bacillus massiliglaciei]|uniref:hypothetical protein n=1 Tax=Bacillus massiliglaciei TaxID=1816693 RepID=UPI000AB77887|nr:hypothetical protein [Bacillus massiliglaciei]
MQEDKTAGIHLIPPKGNFIRFMDEEHYIEKGIEWKLFTGRSVKKELLYKNGHIHKKVKAAGYEQYGDGQDTIVIEFEDGSLSCIHPAYLKEMQSKNFGKELLSGEGKEKAESVSDVSPDTPEPSKVIPEKKGKEKPKKNKKQPKLDLPAEKVHFKASVKEFSAKMNHFTGEEDEVILLEKVEIVTEPLLNIGDAWCSLSKTLKKLELEEGNELEFDGKIVEKKYNKEIIYKINNPSKIVKKAGE